LKLISEHTSAPIVEKVPVNTDLIGAVLAEDVKATESVPAFRASIVDGYAIRIPKDGKFTKGVYPVALVSHAQAGDVEELNEGEIARITTGAPLPPGADAVVMVEDTVLKTQTDDGEEEKEVEILADDVQANENVREVGSDVKEGDTILKKGEGITVVGGEFGLLASVGTAEVSVYRRLVVGILSTGDEIIPHDRPGPLKLGEVRDTNRPTLITSVKNHGFEAVDLGIVSDKYITLSIPPSSFYQLTVPFQTWHTRAVPPRRPPQSRRNNNQRRRLHGRTRPSKTNNRAFPRRHNPLRPREHEARQTHYLRYHSLQDRLRRTQYQNHLLSSRQPCISCRDVPLVCATEFASGEWDYATGLAEGEGTLGGGCED